MLCIPAVSLDFFGDAGHKVAVLDAATLEFLGHSDAPPCHYRVEVRGLAYTARPSRGPTGSAWLTLEPLEE